ncbi:MAG: amidohydrolase family protein [Desulfovibrio sp.]|nr:amidohydrolase [Mailhella sp.]
MELDANIFAQFKKIDAHSHVGRFGSPFDVDFDASRLAAQMDGYNIEKTILCPAGAHLNEELLAAWKAMPERIAPLCWVNANLGQDAYDMLEHYLRDEGFAGVKMQPLFDAFTADSPAVDPIIDIARACGRPVFIHCGHPPFSLPWQIGLLAERHPDVPMVMIHMGHGHGVYIEGSINMALKYDNLFLEVSGMPMGCQIKNAYEKVGAERVMFGIDSPFHHPSVEIQRVLSCGLGDAQLEDVFYRNAAKFMGWL